uniref:Dihydropyrimidinase like 5a n=1 Tax=Maylandia zebra TaxID=106582 RepID=A0A3P9CDW6_9CICH
MYCFCAKKNSPWVFLLFLNGGKVVNDDCTRRLMFTSRRHRPAGGEELMIPGGAKVIDSFMNATTVDDFYSGTKAALAGGTTMVIGHVLPERNESLLEAYEKCRNSADSKACCDYALHIGVTWWGPKMEKLVRDKGVNSFQMFMAYKDMFMLRDSELFQVLQHCKDIGAIARVHAENGELVSEVRDLLGITVCAHCPVYLVNVSSMSAGDVVATAKMQGEALYLLYLVLLSLKQVMCIKGIDTLNVVGSDHRPFTVKQKAMGKDDFTKIPHGLPGIQDRMSVIWERGGMCGKMDENRFVAVTSSNAAKIYNLYPRKGRIIPGADADVVVWDPEGSKVISVKTRCREVILTRMKVCALPGVPIVTISRGRLVYENGMFTCAEGSGKFCPLRTFPDYLYKKMVQREKGIISTQIKQNATQVNNHLPFTHTSYPTGISAPPPDQHCSSDTKTAHLTNYMTSPDGGLAQTNRRLNAK